MILIAFWEGMLEKIGKDSKSQNCGVAVVIFLFNVSVIDDDTNDEDSPSYFKSDNPIFSSFFKNPLIPFKILCLAQNLKLEEGISHQVDLSRGK